MDRGVVGLIKISAHARSIRKQALRAGAASAALVVVGALLLTALGCSGKASDEPTGQGSTPATSTPIPGVATATSSGWSMITLKDGTPAFGAPTELGGGLVWLDKAFFIAGSDSTDVNLLRPFGTEVHRPQQLLVIPWSSVLYQEPLLADAPAVNAITTYLASAPASATVEPDLASGRLAAVFLTSGEVFFGGLTVNGDRFRLDNSHFLRFKDGSDDDERTIESLDDIELIPEAQASAGSTGAMLIPMESILYIQMLAADSPVAGALSQP